MTIEQFLRKRTIAGGRLVAAAFALSLLAGCSTNPATGGQSFTAFMSPSEEIRIGREQDPQIRRQFGGAYDDAALATYVDSIGQKLAANAERTDIQYRFTVLNTDDINAFALPGGYIYVTRGLVTLAGSEAELAGVLAHEIGHVTARHSAERYSHGVVTAIGAGILGAILNDQLASRLINLGADLYLKGYSREQEFEADSLGVRYLARAGYDTAAMAGFLAKLRDWSQLKAAMAGNGDDPDGYDFFATHPRTVDRVEKALEEARLQPNPSPRVGTEDYLGLLDGVIYGEDPSHGLIRDRAFIHPTLGFRFEVPAGFRLANQPDQVIAADRQGSRIIFDQASASGGLAADAYLRDRWAEGVRLRGLETIEVNGMPAATAWLQLTANNAPYVMRLVAIRFDDRTFYRFRFLTPVERTRSLTPELQNTTYSFRRLTDEEAIEPPYRLRVRRFAAGDRIDAYISGFPEKGFEERAFRVLNGLGGAALPAVGTIVKTVAK